MFKKPVNSVPKPPDPEADQRRSTRIDYVTTLLISGKDGSGTPFREYTQTAVVNMHGCKVRTSYRILVGMLVTLECPKAGMWGKGICVRVWDAPPGVAGHEIAVQLVKPQNLWGVPNPPADWEIVAKALAEGKIVPTESPVVLAVNSTPSPRATDDAPREPVTPPPVVTVVPAAEAPEAPPVAAPEVPPVLATAPTPEPPPAIPAVAVQPPAANEPTIEQRLTELERRSTQLVESSLDILRGQAEEYTRSSLEEFRQQMDALIQDAETRIRKVLQQSYEDSAGSLIGLRTDLMEQMASRGAQLIRSAEEGLRTRLRRQMGIQDAPAALKPPEPVAKK